LSSFLVLFCAVALPLGVAEARFSPTAMSIQATFNASTTRAGRALFVVFDCYSLIFQSRTKLLGTLTYCQVRAKRSLSKSKPLFLETPQWFDDRTLFIGLGIDAQVQLNDVLIVSSKTIICALLFT
jgi:hypothetical protein